MKRKRKIFRKTVRPRSLDRTFTETTGEKYDYVYYSDNEKNIKKSKIEMKQCDGGVDLFIEFHDKFYDNIIKRQLSKKRVKKDLSLEQIVDKFNAFRFKNPKKAKKATEGNKRKFDDETSKFMIKFLDKLQVNF